MEKTVQDGVVHTDPLSVQKVDKDTGLPKAGGNATLTVEFQIAYYAGQYTKDNLPDQLVYGMFVLTRTA